MRRVAVGILAFVLAALAPSVAGPQGERVPDAPQVQPHNHVAVLTLHAVRAANGRDAFSFNGQTVPPVVRVSPGDVLKITYVNDLPRVASEPCAVPRCMNMTNLHFHGLGVSPKAPQDDVMSMIAMPGETLKYTVAIPREQPPGLYWFHTHPHGESHQQVLDGMSGAIVVEGIDRYVPEVRTLGERVLVMRGRDIEHDPQAASIRRQVAMSDAPCGVETEIGERVLTINDAIRPEIAIAPGERQFWRLVNASADSYSDVQVDGQPMEVVALDGVPLAFYGPDSLRRKRSMDHLLLPPAGRVEFIVTGPPRGSRSVLRTRCVDTGPAGDPGPAAILADIVSGPRSSSAKTLIGRPDPKGPRRSDQMDLHPPVYKHADVERLKTSAPQFVVTFTEDDGGFYINGRKYAADAEPMTRVMVGSYQHWRIVNDTRELHPMHIHQVHFLAYEQNGTRIEQPEWVDTVNVPYGGSVDVIMDFTDPIIRGMSVFHCHLLNHEDKGMMAKILFE
jgi:FtsP/CotA-like multicopper oxidase with cupredoxin domain